MGEEEPRTLFVHAVGAGCYHPTVPKLIVYHSGTKNDGALNQLRKQIGEVDAQHLAPCFVEYGDGGVYSNQQVIWPGGDLAVGRRPGSILKSDEIARGAQPGCFETGIDF